jgi:hypothetical protein
MERRRPDQPFLMPQVWKATVDGKSMFLFDLPIEEVDEIATRHGVAWLSIIDRPFQTAKVAGDLVEVVAKKLGVAMPVLSSVRVLYGIFDLAEDDLPGSYEDGIPKTPSGPETTG